MLPKFARNEPIKAVYWMLRQMVRNHALIEQANIKIYFRHMHRDYGRMYYYPDRYVIVIQPNLSRKETFRILAHETIHVAQYVTGKIREVKSGKKTKVFWKRKKFFDDKNIEDKLSRTEYFALPWEQEAYKMERKLSALYLENHNVERIFP